MGETAEELRTEELRRDIDDTRASMSGTLEAIGDRVSPGRMLERRRNRIVIWFGDARERVMGTAYGIGDRASGTAQQIGAAPTNTMENVRSSTRGAPLVAGGLAFGVGILVGSLMPPSDTERQLGERARQATEPLKSELQDAGREVVDHLREPVRDAVEDVKGTAQASAEQVKQTAGDSADRVCDTASDSVERARGSSPR